MPAMDHLISVVGVDKTFHAGKRSTVALKSASLEVLPGQVVGLLGPNGAGKTTLLRILAGISRADRGEIRLFGSPPGVELRRRIGFLPERPEFLPHATAAELLTLSLRLSGGSGGEARVTEVLEATGMARHRDTAVGRFSQGMKQRIGLAQALVHRPDLLLLDEPMTGLDPLGRRMAFALIERFHRQGGTVLFSTHHLDDIEAVCTHLVAIQQGAVSPLGEATALRAQGGFCLTAERDGERREVLPHGEAALWAELERLRLDGWRPLALRSDLTRHLEGYYEEPD